jgi:hypothetical protein
MRGDEMRSPGRVLAAAGVASAMILSACGTSPTPSGTTSAISSGAPDDGQIPQPVIEGLPVAPESDRVDLAMPTFSNPTNVTNPLFPVSAQASVLLLGEVDGEAFRTEVTLLPETRIIDWAGQQVEVLISQYAAFLGGQLHEVAYDFYAQADDGSVWYFGEDVFNFADGAIVDTHGTWLAGRDGPAAMIMPADPQVGDVYRPENIPGLVFEEVTVRSLGETVDGPSGPVEGALLVEELHMDGGTEDKTFAPGYGEFFTGAGGDVEALAMMVPIDAIDAAVPADLASLSAATRDALAASRAEQWQDATDAVMAIAGAWDAVGAAGVPPLVEPVMAEAIERLTSAVEAQDAEAAAPAAIDVAQSALDLELRHRPPVEIDMARFDLWGARLELHATAEDEAGVSGDLFALDYVRDRIASALAGPDATAINQVLEELDVAVADGDFGAVASLAGDLRAAIETAMNGA